MILIGQKMQSSIIIVSSLLIISSTTAINRILYLILMVTSQSLIFVLLDKIYIGLTYIIVYVGALAILFIYVVMLLPTRENDYYLHSKYNRVFISILVLTIILMNIDEIITVSYYKDLIQEYIDYSYVNNIGSMSDMEIMGKTLYVTYPVLLNLIAVMLWIVMIGILDILI